MKKVFHFDAPSEAYAADAAVLCCFDQRINLTLRKFLKAQEIVRPDLIIIAGGAKTLASPRNDFERDFILEQIRLSIQLHKTRRLLVMSHSDCATYGGLANFNGDVDAEALHHAGELARAAEIARTNFPQLEVEGYFVNFKGVWRSAGTETGDGSPAASGRLWVAS